MAVAEAGVDSSEVMAMTEPVSRATDLPSGRSPVRMRGPWMSCMRATGRPAAAAKARMRGTTSAISSWLAWEKLRRKRSTPALMRRGMSSSEATTGPQVATILVSLLGEPDLAGLICRAYYEKPDRGSLITRTVWTRHRGRRLTTMGLL